ncbi:uncharacterized protein LOC120079150 [Benincasa hispida]|uniref:uncharacterized protein LOC120079150 n=1 Tax=Benincasa hispida TaxID=102211 RepID=UPI0019028F72|nr:uncharacterized protein LOC120079150 [Benincasa hispida]
MRLLLYDFSPGIIYPMPNGTRFEMKSVMLQMLQTADQFGGARGEDPHAHMKCFLETCNSFLIPGITPEAIRLSLFPYSLRDDAKKWASSLEPWEITTWENHEAATYSIMDKSYNEAKEILDRIAKHNMEWNDALLKSQASSIRNLEIQVGQIASELKNRPPKVLPSNTETPGNSNRKEQCHAVTLRSGKSLVKRTVNPRNNNPSTKHTTRPKAFEDQEERTSDSTSHPNPSTSNAGALAVQLKAPFPIRLLKKNDEQQFKRFLELIRNMRINIPLIEVLEQMLKYVKFLKDILTKKRRVSETKVIALMQECNALVGNNLPKKQKDPGSFTVPYSIEGLDVGHALYDLGASIKFIHLSIFKKLGTGEAQPTSVMFQLADRTITYPEGKIEDVLVKVDKFIFPADFITIDYEADRDVPIILGCPFLATRKMLIDVHKGEQTMHVDNQEMKFNVLKALKFSDDEQCQLSNSIELPEEE